MDAPQSFVGQSGMDTIPFHFQEKLVEFTGEGFVNITEMCAIYRTRPAKFLQLASTKRYIQALEASFNSAESAELNAEFDVQIPDIKRAFFSSKIRGESGTWAHPDLAMECARWLSPEFSIWCNQIIRKIFSGELIVSHRKLPANVPPMLKDGRHERHQFMLRICQELLPARTERRLLIAAREIAEREGMFWRTILIWFWRWERRRLRRHGSHSIRQHP